MKGGKIASEIGLLFMDVHRVTDDGLYWVCQEKSPLFVIFGVGNAVYSFRRLILNRPKCRL